MSIIQKSAKISGWNYLRMEKSLRIIHILPLQLCMILEEQQPAGSWKKNMEEPLIFTEHL